MLTERSDARAFTLLELLVVLVLLSLLTTAAALSLKRPLQNARIERALTQLEDCDRWARAEARKRASPVELRIATDGTVHQRPLTGNLHDESVRAVLDGGFQIDRFLTSQMSADEGELLVRISPTGQSDSYALRLTAGEDHKVWLLVVGASGQTIRSNEEETVERILSLQR